MVKFVESKFDLSIQVPEISTDTNVKRNQGNSLNGDYGATLQINELTEGHTGNYTCRGTQNRNSFVSYHLYVPGTSGEFFHISCEQKLHL